MAKKFALHGALLFTLGLFTGIWSAAALTGTVVVTLPRLALAAHLNGLLGGLWLIAVGATLPYLRYDTKSQARLFYLVAFPSWANWLVTLVASVLGVNGLTYNSDPRNNLIAFSLQFLVVLPSLAGAVYWIRGFCESSPSS